MSDGTPLVAGPTGARRFSDMSVLEKIAHVCKVIAFIVTFGFAYAKIFSD